jgi:hypothetical protein
LRLGVGSFKFLQYRFKTVALAFALIIPVTPAGFMKTNSSFGYSQPKRDQARPAVALKESPEAAISQAVSDEVFERWGSVGVAEEVAVAWHDRFT